MKFISKYPFESLVLLVLVYYDGILLFFEPTNTGNKIAYFFISVLIFFLVMVAGYSFRVELNRFRNRFFKIFLTGYYQKSNIILKILLLSLLGLVPLIVCSLFEFLLTFLLTNAGGITIGFPLPIYSFTAGFVLWTNLVIDLVIYCLLVFFIGRVVSEDPDINDF